MLSLTCSQCGSPSTLPRISRIWRFNPQVLWHCLCFMNPWSVTIKRLLPRQAVCTFITFMAFSRHLYPKATYSATLKSVESLHWISRGGTLCFKSGMKRGVLQFQKTVYVQEPHQCSRTIPVFYVRQGWTLEQFNV